MTAPARLTMWDQALINLCGWVACTRWSDPNRDMMLAQIRRLVPQVSHANPLIAPLAEAAQAVADAGGHPAKGDQAYARLDLDKALAAVFLARGAAACAACWPDENTRPDPPATAA